MNFLFVHQGFPGQYRHILNALSQEPSHTIVGLGISELAEPIPKNVHYYRYSVLRGNTPQIHDWLLDVDSKIIRGEACASTAYMLNEQGFIPDVICCHPGWGEALFLADIWPHSPILCYQEFYYHTRGTDFDFDPEFQSNRSWHDSARIRMKNANPLLMLEQSTWNITPTNFQLSTFPSVYHQKFSVIHDGIDTNLASPSVPKAFFKLPDGYQLTSSSKIVTFVNRHIEPYRGCHSFIRSLPSILDHSSDCHVVIVGNHQGVSYGAPPEYGTWKDVFLSEIDGLYDASRVHFVGNLDYPSFLRLLRLSSCHVYLTYPFVLSWSLLEAMSFSLPIVASRTSPVLEVLTDNHNALLVDFFSYPEIASSVIKILEDNELSKFLGHNARESVVNKYSLDHCVPAQLHLIKSVASRAISRP